MPYATMSFMSAVEVVQSSSLKTTFAAVIMPKIEFIFSTNGFRTGAATSAKPGFSEMDSIPVSTEVILLMTEFALRFACSAITDDDADATLTTTDALIV